LALQLQTRLPLQMTPDRLIKCPSEKSVSTLGMDGPRD
jgi:hypothetical protein